jgi:hypothetical protein
MDMYNREVVRLENPYLCGESWVRTRKYWLAVDADT